MAEKDSRLRRLERTAIAWCVVMMLAAIGWRRGRIDVALGVLGGGLLVAASYWAVRSSVDRLTAGFARAAEDVAPGRRARPRLGFALALFVLRYALLGLFAYVMIARLRLHPIGLFLGASSLVAAAAIETIRATRS